MEVQNHIARINTRWQDIIKQIAEKQAQLVKIREEDTQLQNHVSTIRELLSRLQQIGMGGDDGPAQMHIQGLRKCTAETMEKRQTELQVNQKAIEKSLENLFAHQTAMRTMATQLSPTMRDACVCIVCIDKTVDTVFVPCGHTICSGCATNIPIRCHYCRQLITNKQRMYLSGQGPVPPMAQSLDTIVAAATAAGERTGDTGGTNASEANYVI